MTKSRAELVADPYRFMEAARGSTKGAWKIPSWSDGYGLRVGAVTIQKLGRLAPELAGSHTKSHIFPVGFRSSRIFWSSKNPLQRTLCMCEILDGSKLTEHHLRHSEVVLGAGKKRKRPSDSGGAPAAAAAAATTEEAAAKRGKEEEGTSPSSSPRTSPPSGGGESGGSGKGKGRRRNGDADDGDDDAMDDQDG
ncbi:unnamed protein product, partial [Ectocarpus sp. 8 AP-2014]